MNEGVGGHVCTHNNDINVRTFLHIHSNIPSFSLLFAGQNGGGGPIRRFGRWYQAAEAAGNHIWRKARQTEQRPHARPQN